MLLRSCFITMAAVRYWMAIPLRCAVRQTAPAAEIGACALVRNAPAGERENACTFLDWMTSARGQECYIEAKSCRLPANSTARAADGLPSLDELNLISYDAEWAGRKIAAVWFVILQRIL